jgi:hypothetical protein
MERANLKKLSDWVLGNMTSLKSQTGFAALENVGDGGT